MHWRADSNCQNWMSPQIIMYPKCLWSILSKTTTISGPPGRVTALEVIAKTDTTITVSWQRPTLTGRRDYFYRVFFSSLLGRLSLARDSLEDRWSRVEFTVDGLIPNTLYIIRVTTHNGVSDQDLDNALSRVAEVSSRTAEGSEHF